jgi:hypothetical protein
VSLLLNANGTCDALGKEKGTPATHYLTESLGAAEKSVKERYEYLCLIRFRSSKNSMNSAKTQHPIKTTANDVTVQFMSLSSIAMPSRRTLYYRQAGKAFNEAPRITPAL